MKKTIIRTETRTIEVCDLCERDAANGFHRDCSICGKRCCLTCARAVFPEVDSRVIDWQLTVCSECEPIGAENMRQIQQALRIANAVVVRQTRAWRGMVEGIYTDNKRKGS